MSHAEEGGRCIPFVRLIIGTQKTKKLLLPVEIAGIIWYNIRKVPDLIGNAPTIFFARFIGLPT